MMDWSDVLKLAVSTGVITTALQHLLGTWTSSRNKDDEASYLALRLASVLETYAIQCADRLSDIENYDNTGGTFGSPHTTMPDLPEYPASPDGWRWLEKHRADRVLGYRNKVIGSQRSIISYGEFNAKNAVDLCFKELTDRAKEALEISGSLRAHYSYAAYSMPFYYPELLDRCASTVARRDAEEKVRNELHSEQHETRMKEFHASRPSAENARGTRPLP